jgi:pyrimidine deaminase RibD-like protein
MKISDFQITNHDKLDAILVRLCEMVVEGQYKKKFNLGVVAAAVLDPDNNCVVGINYPTKSGRRVHGERAAIDSYTARFGPIPPGSIVITTCSPCSEPMEEREGESCQDLIELHGIHKVYCGYKDPSQLTEHKTFHTECTRNPKIQALCKAFADTFLKDKLDELEFLGSTCTKDCSGHRAGYAWSQSKGGRVANSPFSPSFNNGSQLYVDGK